jgi:hypothetical protein
MNERREEASARVEDEDMRPEYDFANAVRGKYFRRAIEGTNVVLLEPDVAAVFPDSESVNRALRLLIEVAHREAGDKVLAEK